MVKMVGWNESSDFNEELDDFTLGGFGLFFGVVGDLGFDSGADDESAGVVLLWTVMLNAGAAAGAAFCGAFTGFVGSVLTSVLLTFEICERTIFKAVAPFTAVPWGGFCTGLLA